MFCFGGRRENLELQLPFIHRILEQNPGVEYHLWNLAKDPADAEYISGLRTRNRLKVINDFYGAKPWEKFNDVYRHYATPAFKGRRFVKLDDDVVFIQTDRWPEFIDAVDANPHAVVSANVINNGACTVLDPLLYGEFKRLRMGLLDVHKHPSFAEISHDYFLCNWDERLAQPVAWVSTKDWLSINFIGYDYDMARKFAALLGTPSPRVIAGRPFRHPNALLGDEGMVNTLPRIIVGGFTAAHLTFGPQEKRKPIIWPELRKRYAKMNGVYLKK